MTSAFLSLRVEKAMEHGWDLDRRAWAVLQLIAYEFESDPMSVQCFDLRIVEEAKTLIREARAVDAVLPLSRRLP